MGILLNWLGQSIIAVDNQANAPARQVVDPDEVINMLDANALDIIWQSIRQG